MFGHIRFIEHFTRQYLFEFFKFADYIELNDTVLNMILERFNVKDEFELFKLLDLNLLVVTKGKKGAVFFYKENQKIVSITKVPSEIVDSVDTSGAGDAFFSSILQKYAYTDKINKEFIDEAFLYANKASREILLQFGSRKV